MENPGCGANLGGLDIELEIPKGYRKEGAGQVSAGLHARIWSLAPSWSREKGLSASNSAALPPPTGASLFLLPPHLPSQGVGAGAGAVALNATPPCGAPSPAPDWPALPPFPSAKLPQQKLPLWDPEAS